MRSRNGKGVATLNAVIDDPEPIDQLGGKVNSSPTPNSNAASIITAELSGSDVCTVDGITVQSATPILLACRKLIERGAHPDRELHAYRGDVHCVTVRIGDGAKPPARSGHMVRCSNATGNTTADSPGRVAHAFARASPEATSGCIDDSPAPAPAEYGTANDSSSKSRDSATPRRFPVSMTVELR